MQSTAKTMAKMNKVMNPAQMSKVTQQFTQEHTKLGIKEEMSTSREGLFFRGECARIVLVSETLDAAFGEEGDSEEEDAIVNQVLDEIGISFNEKVCPPLTQQALDQRYSFRWLLPLVFPRAPPVWSPIVGRRTTKMLKSNECWPISNLSRHDSHARTSLHTNLAP